jgi:methylated-DNA-[protein]-cysteine S-methyltransferase
MTTPAAGGIHGARLQHALRGFRARAETAGLVDIAFCTTDSPIGPLLLAASRSGLVRIAFAGGEDAALEELAVRISPRLLEAPQRLDQARRELDLYFEGRLRRFSTPIDWSLVGPFGRRVLHRTAAIPYGQVVPYAGVAREIGAPLAARAVGNALGANPIPVVVPCHRVVRSGGALGGYGGGLERKRYLLGLEGRGSPGGPPPSVTSPAAARSG